MSVPRTKDNVSVSFQRRLAKRRYRELVQKQIGHEAIPLELVIQIAAQGDKQSSAEPEDEIFNYPRHGHGQRSALRVLLRALEKWREEQ